MHYNERVILYANNVENNGGKKREKRRRSDDTDRGSVDATVANVW